MANDRIFVECKKCGEYLTLLKFYPAGALEPYMTAPDAVDQFLCHHILDCHGFRGRFDLDGEECFILHTESTKREAAH